MTIICNERIQELAAHCEGSTICECGEVGFNYEKFAELIVKECISYIDSRDYFSGSEGIAEHFGVK